VCYRSGRNFRQARRKVGYLLALLRALDIYRHVYPQIPALLMQIMSDSESRTWGSKMTDVTAVTDTQKSKGRSAISNGKLADGVDGRGREARRFRDVLDALVVQFDAIDEAALSLCRRAAGLAVWIEQQEALVAKGEPVDIGAMMTAGNSYRRMLRDLQASRRQRTRPDIT